MMASGQAAPPHSLPRLPTNHGSRIFRFSFARKKPYGLTRPGSDVSRRAAYRGGRPALCAVYPGERLGKGASCPRTDVASRPGHRQRGMNLEQARAAREARGGRAPTGKLLRPHIRVLGRVRGRGRGGGDAGVAWPAVHRRRNRDNHKENSCLFWMPRRMHVWKISSQ